MPTIHVACENIWHVIGAANFISAAVCSQTGKAWTSPVVLRPVILGLARAPDTEEKSNF